MTEVSSTRLYLGNLPRNGTLPSTHTLFSRLQSTTNPIGISVLPMDGAWFPRPLGELHPVVNSFSKAQALGNSLGIRHLILLSERC
jgi:hypothetical protein